MADIVRPSIVAVLRSSGSKGTSSKPVIKHCIKAKTSFPTLAVGLNIKIRYTHLVMNKAEIKYVGA